MSEKPERSDAYAAETPEWAKDPFNGDAACSCGYCGSWMEVVRPGKVQCSTCLDGEDLAAIARGALKAHDGDRRHARCCVPSQRRGGDDA